MNKVILIGNLTKDPEVRTTASGTCVTTFTVAVKRYHKNDDGTKETDFIPVVTWQKLAESCGRYLKKGNRVGVVGEIQVRSYDAKDGTKRYVTEVIAGEVEFLTPKEQDKIDTSGFTDIDDSNLPF